METVYLKPADAADYTCLSVATLARMRVTGDGPPFMKLGHRLVVYSKGDLDAWLTARKRRSTADCDA
ncbi:helix-turn-helix transcriptional regulator [Tepidamorphus sp. 3E244]|uniref:helix-turn-helix transcriptional regulator n=1 Tax=Tepidamorphus sp. 3E244 TaxID=3385498 RepID=UPI0038FCD17C